MSDKQLVNIWVIKGVSHYDHVQTFENKFFSRVWVKFGDRVVWRVITNAINRLSTISLIYKCNKSRAQTTGTHQRSVLLYNKIFLYSFNRIAIRLCSVAVMQCIKNIDFKPNFVHSFDLAVIEFEPQISDYWLLWLLVLPFYCSLMNSINDKNKTFWSTNSEVLTERVKECRVMSELELQIHKYQNYLKMFQN